WPARLRACRRPWPLRPCPSDLTAARPPSWTPSPAYDHGHRRSPARRCGASSGTPTGAAAPACLESSCAPGGAAGSDPHACCSSFPRPPGLAVHVLIGVADPLALVRLGRAALAQVGGDLPDELLIGPLDHDAGRLGHFERDAFRRLERHRMR